MSLLPNQFLFRIAHPCRKVASMPKTEDDMLLDLPEDCRIDNFAAMDDRKSFADVRLAWNEHGIGLQVSVVGKDKLPQGDAARPRSSDGVSFWIDTRDSRASHRASRYCHQFYLLPTGGGPDHDEPVLQQTKIHRALQDAPLADFSDVPFRVKHKKSGYLLEAFFPSAVLNGYDPEQNTRLGFFYTVRDEELGDQTLSIAGEFPYWEDPTLWSVLELVQQSK